MYDKSIQLGFEFKRISKKWKILVNLKSFHSDLTNLMWILRFWENSLKDDLRGYYTQKKWDFTW